MPKIGSALVGPVALLRPGVVVGQAWLPGPALMAHVALLPLSPGEPLALEVPCHHVTCTTATTEAPGASSVGPETRNPSAAEVTSCCQSCQICSC